MNLLIIIAYLKQSLPRKTEDIIAFMRKTCTSIHVFMYFNIYANKICTKHSCNNTLKLEAVELNNGFFKITSNAFLQNL